MGLQRHLKVLGIFARLYLRDGKDGYLKDLADREKERLKLIFRDKAYKDFKVNCEVNE